MSADAEIAKRAPEYDHVAVPDLDTRYAELRLAAPESVAALSRSIARHGLQQPLTVNRQGDALVILDGFKRLRALSDAGAATVPVRILGLTEAQATAALVTFNRPHRGVSELEEAWVVYALVTKHHMIQRDVAELLGRHKSWVCRRLGLAQRLDKTVVDDMRLGLISATVARELVRLPRGNQPPAAAAIQRHGLTSRQTAELVQRLLAIDDDGKRELLDDPLRYLTSPPASPPRRDARLGEAGEKIRRSLDALARQARTTDRTIHSPTTGVVVCTDLEVLRPMMRDVAGTLRTILATLSSLLTEEDNA